MNLKDRMMVWAAETLGSRLLVLLYKTWKIRSLGEEHFPTGEEPWSSIIVTWHGRLLAPLLHERGKGIMTLISQHRDGELIARVAGKLGYQVTRGSSTRGGKEAFRELLGFLKIPGKIMAVQSDGPTGPYRQLKPGGSTVLASRTGSKLVCMGFDAESAWVFKSWDRFTVPKPFSVVKIIVAEPIAVPRTKGLEDLQPWNDRVTAVLNQVSPEKFK